MSEYENVTHNFAPVWDEQSRILILGTFPSVKSRENHFYYGHPQNRFWKVLAALTDWEVPQTIEEKKAMLLANHIAIWDVIASCQIIGSSDSSIRDVVVNDIQGLLQKTNIQKIYANGGKASELYKKYVFPDTGHEIIKLPSTSPANAAFRLERLITEWGTKITIK
mgnify:CR=1 FL=1